jgi:hypothetical protein
MWAGATPMQRMHFSSTSVKSLRFDEQGLKTEEAAINLDRRNACFVRSRGRVAVLRNAHLPGNPTMREMPLVTHLKFKSTKHRTFDAFTIRLRGTFPSGIWTHQMDESV